jgi:hypothetical protein
MTHRAETRFICDRCNKEEILQTSNGPPHARSGGPEGWLPMTIGSDPSLPVRHFCPSCAGAFKSFMSEEKHGEA